MILYKNQNSQVVYTKVVNITNGSLVTNATLNAFLSKDDGPFTALGTVKNYNNGVYSVTLTADQTNCDTGYILFTGVLVNQQADQIFFGTSEKNPTVGSVVGNVGTSSSPISMYVNKISTDGATGPTDIRANINNSITNVQSIVNGIKNETYSGITQDKLNNLLLAFIAGKAEIDPPIGDQVLIKYNYFGTNTELLRIYVNFNNGERQNSGTFDYSGG